MALEQTRPLREMSTKNLPGSKGRPARKADLTAICEPTVWKMWELRPLTTLWAFTACYRDTDLYLSLNSGSKTKSMGYHTFFYYASVVMLAIRLVSMKEIIL
jgi:hypothetical protein